MAATLQLVLWKRPNRDGKYPIYIRVIKNRKVFYKSTNQTVNLNDWDKDKGKVKPSHPNSARFNNYLKQLELEYSNNVLAIENEDLSIGLRGIKRKILGQDATNFSLVAKELQNKYKIEGKIGTSDKVGSIIKKFCEYMQSENFTFQDIDFKTLINYQRDIMERLKNKASTANKDLKFIKTVFLYAQRMEYIQINTNPFLNFKFLKTTSERGFLVPEEIGLIEQLDCSHIPYIQKAKDIILFQYYSGGLRISDVLLLKWENIIENRVHLTIRKTGKQTSHKLTSKAIQIIEKYIPLENEFIFGYLPNDFNTNDLIKVDAIISSCTAVINKALKTIATKCGINKRLSTHLLRHSFATNALQQGMSLEVLQNILKHSNIRETQIYAKVLNQKVDAEMDKLNL
ncbi:MAG: site-specific integrase [Chitinophagaceae bacterium]|nr:site-specific integrase [Chitinophagaceae bacterium]